MKLEQALEEQYEERGNDHVGSSTDTPMRDDAFVLSDEEKIERIQKRCLLSKMHRFNIFKSKKKFL